MSGVEIRLGGGRLELHPSGAALDTERGRLFVADLHLGKGAALRSAGLPIPGGTSRETMRRVADVVARRDPAVREVWVLGDLIHAPAGLDAILVDEVGVWIDALPGGVLHLVRGNHDRVDGGLPARWAIRSYPDPHDLEAFRVAHVPPAGAQERAPTGKPKEPPSSLPEATGTLAGHLHPKVRAGRGRTRTPPTPAFVGWGGSRSRPEVLVLPAQGRLVDGAVVRGRPGMHAWACADGGVLALPDGGW